MGLGTRVSLAKLEIGFFLFVSFFIFLRVNEEFSGGNILIINYCGNRPEVFLFVW